MDIADSRNLNLLVIEGKADGKTLIETWERIIARNSEANSSMEYGNYVSKLRQLTKMLQEYTMLKAAVVVLYLKPDRLVVEYLNKKGYRVKTDSAEGYYKSLEVLMSKHNALSTRIQIKQNEIAAIQSQEEKTQTGFDNVMAYLWTEIGPTVPDDITLARYNELKKIIKARQPKKQNGKVK